ncbi:MAG: MBL fold metallo-hydrolase [Akkermansia sp.]|nr:MBL fold metallo-hydrolase [Akkermansia sp.]
MISFTNLSGALEIGSNCYLLEMDGVRIALDAGMHPKREGNAAMPDYGRMGEAPDAMFVTHAHLDHIGTLPVFQSLFPSAQVFMTRGTAVLGGVMLHNSVNVMTSKRASEGIAEYPLFSHKELERACQAWTERPYNECFRVGGGDGVRAVLYDAGHILGSCGVYLESPSGRSLFYTGDVQFDDQSLIPGADFPADGVDILVMECTHGSAERAAGYTRRGGLERFARAIDETLRGGGAVLVPVFALGKSQEILYNIQKFKEKGLIPDAPVYFGGLGSKVAAVYDKLSEVTPRLHPGCRLKDTVEVVPLPRREPVRVSPGSIYLVSSGMMNEKTLSNQLAGQVLPRGKDAILFVGYCDEDSPAGCLKASEPGANVRLQERDGQLLPRRCRVESFDFSGHASRGALVHYAELLKPAEIVLVHGDPEAIEEMRRILKEIVPDARIIVPQPNVAYTLDGGAEREK